VSVPQLATEQGFQGFDKAYKVEEGSARLMRVATRAPQWLKFIANNKEKLRKRIMSLKI
jgi:hypothetical protein